jgi:hypothetical protein
MYREISFIRDETILYNTEVLNLKFGYKALYTSGVLNWKSKCTAFEYIRLSNKSGV